MSVPFEGVLAQDGLKGTLRKRATLTASLLVHAAVLLAGVIYSFWRVEELPLPTLAVTLHLGAPPPPPPPPPPAAKRSPTQEKSKPVELTPDNIVQPKSEAEDEIVPAEDNRGDLADDNDEGEEGGQEGGQEGGTLEGVKGGVLGGMVGSVELPPQIANALLLIDPHADEYRVKLPRPLARAGITFVAVIRICVSAQGAVTEVQVVRPADPAIDPQIPVVIGRWRYRPYTIDGRPVPFCYLLKYKIVVPHPQPSTKK